MIEHDLAMPSSGELDELEVQMAALRAELDSLKARTRSQNRAVSISRIAPLPTQTQTQPKTQPGTTSTTSSGARRKTLKRLGLALLGGAAAATVTGFSVSEAKIITSPTLGTSTSKAGAIVLPQGAPGTTNNTLNGFYYGLIASGSSGYLDLGLIPYANIGVYGYGDSATGAGLYGTGSSGATGVSGYGYGSGKGISGFSQTGPGVYGESGGSGNGANGVFGYNYYNGNGVYGYGTTGNGVYGYSPNGSGICGRSDHANAGYFLGNVYVSGSVSKTGGSFKIDHPLDPANKFLYHSFVESPDMLNIYNGLVTLDGSGEAVIEMPDWFEALNSDFRYQLTCLGEYSQVYIAEEMKDRRFKIAGGKPGQKISWMVTGVRQDAWAKVNRIPVEEEKTGFEKGKYLHPELFGQSEELSIHQLPELSK